VHRPPAFLEDGRRPSSFPPCGIEVQGTPAVRPSAIKAGGPVRLRFPDGSRRLVKLRVNRACARVT